MTDTSMIERVARAIREANKGEYTSDAQAELIARAAIEAMREPTDNMADEGYRSIHKGADAVWSVMIDKALES